MKLKSQKILLTEGSSLSVRETLTALRGCGYQVDILSSAALPMAAFSRWRHRLIRTVNVNLMPQVYLKHLVKLVQTGHYAAVVPTHETAWLLAEAVPSLPRDFPAALAPAEAFRYTQSKIHFAELLDILGLPQPEWQLAASWQDVTMPCPLWVKAEYGTAGRSVRRVCSARQLADITMRFERIKDNRLMVQADIRGQYGQVQALFNHGKMIAVHTTMQTGLGAGNSAAARRSVDIPAARRHIAVIGEYLGWHGPLTIDFICRDGRLYYIECNPRMVEPANAQRAGVNFPDLLIRLSAGMRLDGPLQVGAAGVCTHSLEALLLGAAERYGTRRAVVRTMRRYAFARGSTEVLTPVRQDPSSLIPLATVSAALLINPRSVDRITAGAVRAYCVRPETVSRVNIRPPANPLRVPDRKNT